MGVMMDCCKVQEVLSEFLDGRLQGKDKNFIEDHLHECLACRAEYKKLKNLVTALKSLPEVPAPPNFLAILQQRLAETNKPWWKKVVESFDRTLSTVPLKAMTVAAAAILAVTVFVVSNQSGPGNNEVAGNLPTPITGGTNTISGTPTGTDPVPNVATLPIGSPEEFITAIVKNDPEFRDANILPHPNGNGVLLMTKDYLIEVVIDPAEFTLIQSRIQLGDRLPRSLREAKMRNNYPIFMRILPNPTKPITPPQP